MVPNTNKPAATTKTTASSSVIASDRNTLVAKETMVKVWYEPPPGGPRTNLNRGAYYTESALTPDFIKKMSKARPITVVLPAVSFFAFICYLPLMSPKNLPGTLNPEYLAAQRAYMRYHNMNPIYGTSSKRSRAADPDP